MDVYAVRCVPSSFSRGTQRMFTAHNVQICYEHDGFHAIAKVPADLSLF